MRRLLLGIGFGLGTSAASQAAMDKPQLLQQPALSKRQEGVVPLQPGQLLALSDATQDASRQAPPHPGSGLNDGEAAYEELAGSSG